jgi:hypothetical protein
VASGREGRRPAGVGHLPRAAALLRLAADPARRIGEDRPGPAGPRERRRDARHLQPPLARLGRPDEGRRGLGAEDHRGLIEDSPAPSRAKAQVTGGRRTSRPVRRVLSTGASRPPDGRSSI